MNVSENIVNSTYHRQIFMPNVGIIRFVSLCCVCESFESYDYRIATKNCMELKNGRGTLKNTN